MSTSLRRYTMTPAPSKASTPSKIHNRASSPFSLYNVAVQFATLIFILFSLVIAVLFAVFRLYLQRASSETTSASSVTKTRNKSTHNGLAKVAVRQPESQDSLMFSVPSRFHHSGIFGGSWKKLLVYVLTGFMDLARDKVFCIVEAVFLLVPIIETEPVKKLTSTATASPVPLDVSDTVKSPDANSHRHTNLTLASSISNGAHVHEKAPSRNAISVGTSRNPLSHKLYCNDNKLPTPTPNPYLFSNTAPPRYFSVEEISSCAPTGHYYTDVKLRLALYDRNAEIRRELDRRWDTLPRSIPPAIIVTQDIEDYDAVRARRNHEEIQLLCSPTAVARVPRRRDVSKEKYLQIPIGVDRRGVPKKDRAGVIGSKGKENASLKA